MDSAWSAAAVLGSGGVRACASRSAATVEGPALRGATLIVQGFLPVVGQVLLGRGRGALRGRGRGELAAE